MRFCFVFSKVTAAEPDMGIVSRGSLRSPISRVVHGRTSVRHLDQQRHDATLEREAVNLATPERSSDCGAKGETNFSQPEGLGIALLGLTVRSGSAR